MKKTHSSKIFTHVILWASLLFFISAIIWANYAILDEVTTGQGKVIPSSEVQVIQNLEGGIIQNIFVKEGQIVKKDQILMQIDNTRFMSSYAEAEKKIDALEIEIIRLNAEISNTKPVFPEKLTKTYPHLVQDQLSLYESRMRELNQLEKSLELAQKELNLTRPLLKGGSVSEVEVIRLERTVSEIRGNIEKFKSEELDRLNKARSELFALIEANKADKDRLTRTTVRSPVYGIVKQIKTKTIGGVVQPGNDLLEIVPLDDTLLIEAKIRPSDIGFIHPGQKAMVKITAYDFSIYGGLEGVVEHISADTIIDEKTDKKEESYYIVKVRTEKNYLGTEKKPLPIIPGMQATVDILTGQKSVLQYLLKPIIKAKQSALRER
ncbi:TPA: HlyD family type I secretion periplasmic adaptor subunit [Legionella pneumophila subsp. pneumophila]|uniref:Membrane fusion protein (MFP) family protein n=1 Tax=Legionella pneumophila (strain Lens) TaxID=297245 RepID=Q5WWE4_LEGPL|nr:HlyD family type I secretion periplasmic adaptor subunit [Legionella pneumophila]AOW51906.1 hemolysin secretion protein D [Legionella pneumophila subsp. pneumophila]AOW54500.1 hemolysin secretion protein D [Legionella pneumophila subsp. pneumophila]AOW57203.1 hemolysin secretion protein D [Legionella pneumophila subsp. pneumophila]AOW59870.1 hemolysin secretion protein D [Legionella pneumophila subsp. pneumophila]AOW62700.1 hemolysin secretion protein D [Legionella pneumophila subsp. pneumo